MIVDGVDVTVTGGTVTEAELRAYIARGRKKFGCITRMDVKIDGEYADIDYRIKPAKFERVRRITGYLVGTLDRFNNAKRAEVSERVKHNI